jgi:putative ABC transport system permease protein
MKLALKEIKYDGKKYLLVETIMVLMVFMVLFLSGLVNGLGRAVSSSIDNMEAEYYILSDDSEGIISVSDLNKDVLTDASEQSSNEVAPLDIQRMYINTEESNDKIDITYLAMEPNSFLMPDMVEGSTLSTGDSNYQIILNDTFKEDGIHIGDVVRDSSTDVQMTVVGFASDEMYGHTAAGIISMETYVAIRKALNPQYELSYHAIAVKGNNIEDINIDGTEVMSKIDIINKIPGYTAEQMTINMVLWVMVVISAAILGVFFYVLTIQKEKQFGILKAIGVSMKELTYNLTAQMLILSLTGAVLGNGLAFIMAAFLPSSIPFYLTIGNACLVTLAFILISIVSSLFSTIKVAKVDPLISIGGNA